MREPREYLINPPMPNPYELFTVPARRVVAHTTKRGRFIKTATVAKGPKEATRRISAASGKALIRFTKTGKLTKKGLAVLGRPKPKKVAKKTSKKTKGETKRTLKTVKALTIRPMTTAIIKTAPKKSAKKKTRKNPLLTFNPIKRRHSMRRKYAVKRYRRNPIMVSSSEVKGLGQLAIDGAIAVGGAMVGKTAVDFATTKVGFLNTPVARIGAHLALGAATYVAGTRFAKKDLHKRIVRMATLGVIFPAVMDIMEMIKGKIYGVGPVGSYVPTDLNAYVPEMNAYVPEMGAGDYSGSY